MTERFVVGLLGAPFGLNGCIKVRSLSGECDHLLRLDQAILRQHGKERAVSIQAVRPLGGSVIMQFAGITTPELARTVTGAELLVERRYAAPLKEGEYYVEDLRGLEVYAPDAGETDRPLGILTGILEGGGGSLAELTLPSGAVVLVPFRDEFFGAIDLERRRVVLQALWMLA